MREYKFRGNRIDNGQWVYGSLLQSEIDVNQLYVQCQIHERFADDFSIAKYNVKPETVGMWTGLKDKNGNDIYEGDLIRFAETYLYIVKYEDAKFVGYHANNDWGKWGDLYKLAEPHFNKYRYVVIGNIHDNPELFNDAPAIEGTHHMTTDPREPGQPEQGQTTETQPEVIPDSEEGNTEG